MYSQEWCCAWQKLDKTDTERCLGIDELEGLCGTPWQMVAPELKWTKKVTADKEGAGDARCQGLWLKERQKSNPEDSTSCLRILKLTDRLETAQDAQRLSRMEKRQSHMAMNSERE